MFYWPTWLPINPYKPWLLVIEKIFCCRKIFGQFAQLLGSLEHSKSFKNWKNVILHFLGPYDNFVTINLPPTALQHSKSYSASAWWKEKGNENIVIVSLGSKMVKIKKVVHLAISSCKDRLFLNTIMNIMQKT